MLLEEAYGKYSRNMVLAMVRFSRDETAAADAVSQAFTKALSNRTMLEAMPEPAMRAWLYSAARNALIDGKRKEARYTLLDDSYEQEAPQDDPVDRILVESLVDELPSQLRMPVVLKYYQNLNATQIGKILGVPAATVRTRIRTALGLMRNMMKGEL